jgi:glycosyltransferase involved in cell wall biosynthesis
MHPLLLPTRTAAQIVTVHDLDFLDNPERTRAEIRRDYPVLAAAHAKRADRVVAVSNHTAAEVERRLEVPSSKITVCSPGRPAWPKRLMEPANGGILFLGTLEPRKNLAILLDAYEQLVTRYPGAPPLTLAGGHTADSTPIIERTTRPPLAGRVELTGYVDPARRQEHYRRALVFVLPSHAEGFGIPALEAMTCGVPVIAANRGALPEVVGSAGVLFDATDSGALAEALHRVLTDRGARERMRQDGWTQAERYDWRETARRVREAWEMASAARRRRRASEPNS